MIHGRFALSRPLARPDSVVWGRTVGQETERGENRERERERERGRGRERGGKRERERGCEGEGERERERGRGREKRERDQVGQDTGYIITPNLNLRGTTPNPYTS